MALLFLCGRGEHYQRERESTGNLPVTVDNRGVVRLS